jgi:hypothetical protein
LKPRRFPSSYRFLVKRLARAREFAELTPEEIDSRLNLEAGSCAEWEAQLRAIDPISLCDFAAITMVSEEWMRTGSGSLTKRHPPVYSVQDALNIVGSKADSNKKNWSESFSRALAILFANSLRADFEGITPDEFGRRQERPARTNRGYKKLDVGYATEELGLALGLSVKSINFRDENSERYTKNYSRNDNELRAEAMDYHRRQPYAVLAGVLMLPIDSCDDGDATPDGESSFAAAVRYFRRRAGRYPPIGDADLFESFFIGLYDQASPDGSNDFFFDVFDSPPKKGRPVRRTAGQGGAGVDLSLDEMMGRIKKKYDDVNSYSFTYSAVPFESK